MYQMSYGKVVPILLYPQTVSRWTLPEHDSVACTLVSAWEEFIE
jgi:hypothetical protein